MILLDTNVLIDGFRPQAVAHDWALGVIRSALLDEGAAINSVILAELMVGEAHPETLVTRLGTLGILLLDLPVEAASRCAEAFDRYLENRKQQHPWGSPKVPLPDFFIGAHAALLDLRLATSDVGRYRTYFPEVELICPSAE